MKTKDKGTLEFNVDTMALLHEIADNAIHSTGGVLKIPLNIFKNLLAQVANRAIEIDDPELHILMLRLGLYEVPHDEIPRKIEELKKQLKS